jgi:hypothetical protein
MSPLEMQVIKARNGNSIAFQCGNGGSVDADYADYVVMVGVGFARPIPAGLDPIRFARLKRG